MQNFINGAKHVLTAAFTQPPQLDANTTILLTAAARRLAPGHNSPRPGPR